MYEYEKRIKVHEIRSVKGGVEALRKIEAKSVTVEHGTGSAWNAFEVSQNGVPPLDDNPECTLVAKAIADMWPTILQRAEEIGTEELHSLHAEAMAEVRRIGDEIAALLTGKP